MQSTKKDLLKYFPLTELDFGNSDSQFCGSQNHGNNGFGLKN